MKTFFSIMLFSIMIFTSACSVQQERATDKISDVEFTVVEEIDIPQEVKALIEERKASPFQLAFITGENSYIMVGYGEQATGGYSITVNECYLAEDGIHVVTNLLGPEKDATVDKKVSYPYIVLKMEATDKEIIFEP